MVKGYWIFNFESKTVKYSKIEREGIFYKGKSHFRIWKLSFIW